MWAPCLKRVEGELDVARVERGAPLVLAHHGRKILEGRLPQDLVRLLLQDLLDDLLLCLKRKCNIDAPERVLLQFVLRLVTFA